MKRSIILFSALAAVAWAPAAMADALINRMDQQLSAARDYTCDIRMDANLPDMTVRDMKMKLYYKRPNKVHVEATEGFAVLPEEGLFLGNPVEELQKRFVLARMGDATWNGKHTIKYSVRPTQDQAAPLSNIRLYVDPSNALPVAVYGQFPQGGTLSTEFSFRKMQGQYWLPTRTVLKISGMQSRTRSGKQDGSATLTYSNYKINTGLSDSLFQPKKKPGSK